MRIALFGGTFDPIHTGHLLLAEAARENFRLQRVIFVPAGQPPHKKTPAASAVHRLALVRLAIRGNPAFAASDWEIRQSRIVYTYETLAHFTRQYPRDRWFFIIGSDSLRDIPRWRQGGRLLKQSRFLIVERPGAEWRTVPVALRRRVRRVEAPAFPFASHEIRRKIRQGRSIRYQVPESVERYIRSHRLYRRTPS